jgi:hypothetical protein
VSDSGEMLPARFRLLLMGGLLFPSGIYILSSFFEYRNAFGSRCWSGTSIPSLIDLALVGLLIFHFLYGIFVVWYCKGRRGEILFYLVLEICLSAFLVVADIPWSGGPW